MILILDNIAAFIIGSTIFLVLMAMQMRTTEMNIDQTSTYMMKNQAASFSTWIEEDLLNLGEHMDKSVTTPFANPVYDQHGNTTSFTFYQDTLNTTVVPADTVRIATRYNLAFVGYSTSTGDSTAVYKLERSVRYQTGPWQDEGESVPLISVFRIDMLDMNAQPIADPVAAMTADPTSVRNTRIRFAMVPPIETSRATLNKIFYGSTLLIPN
ncbi:MAG: hypothetical protein KDD65_17275 [Bacteroidetes bacterium]|nr:hypothetical protein [Bacteroidota bacterium]